MSESLDPAPATATFRDGVRGALVFVVAAPFTAAVVAATAAGTLSLTRGPLEAEGLVILLAPVLVFAGALIPAAVAGFVTGAGATRVGGGKRIYLLAGAAGALATLIVHAGRFLPDVGALGLVGALAVPPCLVAAWFGAQIGVIGRDEDR
ncbi:hypothetical protein [Caulobacter sp. 17J80-11]|uniref:hypothetical protein n=1 Tax=Caulobacter sp. 17J80-11 TaxID=2763502 RepID=UPI0016537A8E|nr:hypothetical protein [Caulobacter sp. 17J80-11]MBC6982053.1 hypothetical protein [Caulobacter sp. 17J80-11]